MTGVENHPPVGRRRRQEVARQPLTTRIGQWSASHPWLAIAAWVFVVVASVVGGSVAGTVKATAQDSLHGELASADRIERSGGFPDPPAAESVLIAARGGELDLVRARAAAAVLSERMRALPEVAKIAEPVTAPNRDALLVEVEISGSAQDADARVEPLLEATTQTQHRYSDLRVEQVGSASLAKALTDTLAADFRKAELISVPVALLILLVSFGALIAAGVPVVLALTAVAGVRHLRHLVDHRVQTARRRAGRRDPDRRHDHPCGRPTVADAAARRRELVGTAIPGRPRRSGGTTHRDDGADTQIIIPVSGR